MLAAAVQISSKANKQKNLKTALRLMSRAVKKGAKLVALPEYFSLIGSRADYLREAEQAGKGPAYEAMCAFAKTNGVYVLAGTIPTVSGKAGDQRLFNRSTLFGPDGKELAHYDKAHLFDTEFEETATHRESETFRHGSGIKTADTVFGKVGFAICYDLRFPELFRAMALKGARVIFMPAAFTKFTGKAHWLTLLKARAIENQVYIIAPAQVGKHAPKKESFGKTCVIDPWGNILAIAPDRETAILAELDFKRQDKIRRELPVLKHYRKDLFDL